MPVSYCELVVLHSYPVEGTSSITDKVKHGISPLLMCEVVTTESGKKQYDRMLQMAYVHYQLASTTVTGIPMKVNNDNGQTQEWKVYYSIYEYQQHKS